MYSASRASSETESSSDRSVDSGIGWLLAIEGVVSVDGTARHLSNFAGQLEKQKVHRQIGENIGAGQILRQRDSRCVGGGSRRYGALSDVRADVGRRIVLVLAEAGRQTEQQQALARRDAPRLRLQAEVVHVEQVSTAVAGDV